MALAPSGCAERARCLVLVAWHPSKLPNSLCMSHNQSPFLLSLHFIWGPFITTPPIITTPLGKTTTALGRHNGFVSNDGVRIPPSPGWGEIEADLRAVGLTAASDEFIGEMNSAAGQTAFESRGRFLNTARILPVDSARVIVPGPVAGATLLFRVKAHQEFLCGFLPIVKHAARQSRFAEMRSSLFYRAREFGRDDDGKHPSQSIRRGPSARKRL